MSAFSKNNNLDAVKFLIKDSRITDRGLVQAMIEFSKKPNNEGLMIIFEHPQCNDELVQLCLKKLAEEFRKKRVREILKQAYQEYKEKSRTNKSWLDRFRESLPYVRFGGTVGYLF